MQKIVIFLCTCIWLEACVSHSQNDNNKPAITESYFQKNAARLQGSFFLDLDKGLFRACNKEKYITLVDLTDSLEGKYIEMLPFRHNQEPVYLEATGVKNATNDTFFVTAMNNMSSFDLHSPCFTPLFQCAGTEPFWTLSIQPELNLITFRDYSNMESNLFDISVSGSSKLKTVYQGKNENKEEVKITINKENCSDGMSDQVFQYRSTVEFRGKKWIGCAAKN